MLYVKLRLIKEKEAKKMKRFVILILLMTALITYGQEENNRENEATEETTNQNISKCTKDNEIHKKKNNNSKEQKSNNETVEKPTEKTSEKPEKETEEKNEKVEVATENIIWAQNDRDYSTLKDYLGQNITLDDINNLLKITNVDYPHEAELLEGIDRKSTRLNSSHVSTSYAVFCLKKKTMALGVTLASLVVHVREDGAQRRNRGRHPDKTKD